MACIHIAKNALAQGKGNIEQALKLKEKSAITVKSGPKITGNIFVVIREPTILKSLKKMRRD